MTGYSADLAVVCGCSWAATGMSIDEVVGKVTKHAKDAHGMNEVPAELAQKLHGAMRPAM